MPSTLNTPGVYIEEISKFPPSVAAVGTAIPAFIGHTEKGTPLNLQPTRIASLLEFETLYGGAPSMSSIAVTLKDDGTVDNVTPAPKYYLYHSLRIYFANGGGPCYIVRTGDYGTPVAKDDLVNGVNALLKEDEPTLLLCPDANVLTSITDHRDVCTAMLGQCEKLQDRFAILDVFDGSKDFSVVPNKSLIDNFRGIPSNSNLKFGAAYYPFLQTTISIPFDHSKITGITWTDYITDQGDLLSALGAAATDITAINAVTNANAPDSWTTAYTTAKATDAAVNATETTARQALFTAILNGGSGIKDLSPTEALPITDPAGPDPNSISVYFTAVDTKADGILAGTIDETTIDGKFNQAVTLLNDLSVFAQTRIKNLEDQLALNNSFYANVRQSVTSQGVTLPPCGAVAGAYASVDRNRGVWKAPANVGLNMVSAPTAKISHDDHGLLNVDPTGGKSINAIRSYTGKGVMIYGARTLSGNSNEWRYVSVRRFFNFVEESVKKASEQFVFEPNDANTWARVKGMISNFLYNQWRAGALAGAKPEEAFYVKIGLPETMTAVDILEGKLNIEIGMAAVRPAEFIVLKFSHKMQTS